MDAVPRNASTPTCVLGFHAMRNLTQRSCSPPCRLQYAASKRTQAISVGDKRVSHVGHVPGAWHSDEDRQITGDLVLTSLQFPTLPLKFFLARK